jgi:hypothetical protein
MALAAYDIVGQAGAWHVQHDGVTRNTYETKEAAVAAASFYAARPRHPHDGASK